MKLSVEDVNSVKKILHIEVPQETVVKELDKAYAQMKKTAKVKGFRPGKAPRSVLERMYGKEITSDVTGQLIQDSLTEAIQTEDLAIIGRPAIDPPDLDASTAYAYAATVEINPVLGEIDFKGLALKKNLYAATDDEMDAQLAMIQKNMAKMEPIADTRPAADGDVVLINYEGFKDGVPFEPTKATENYMMKLGEGRIDKALDDAVMGMAVEEEKDIEVAFAEDHKNTELAGQTINFKVTLHDIREEVIPQLDDELAKKMGGEIDSLEALKEKIHEHLQQGYDKRSEQELNEQVFEALIEKTDFELPETAVEHELQGIIQEAERNFQYHNTSMEQLGLDPEQMGEKYRPTAEKQVRRYYILGQIVKQENLELSDAELDEGFEDMAARFQQPVEQVKQFYQQSPEQVDMLKQGLLEKKAIKLIIESGQVEEVTPVAEKETENADDKD